MEWDDLRHFLAVARTGSLTDAARTLKSSAATVSRHVEALEEKLGAQLFERRSTGYLLTDTGTAVLAKAEEAEDAVLALERETMGADLRLSGRVRVATTEDLATMVIVPALPSFCSCNPLISLEVLARLDLSSLTRRDADLALRTVRPDKGELLMRRVGAVDLAIYASPGYVVSRRLGDGPVDFSKVEIVSWIEEMANLRGGAWLAEHAAGSRIALRVNTTRLLFDACRAGLGLAILPCFGADGDQGLVCVVPPEQVISIDAWLVMHRDLARTARVRAVADFIVSLGPRLSRRPSPADRDWH